VTVVLGDAKQRLRSSRVDCATWFSE